MLNGQNSQFFDIHARQSKVSEAQIKLAKEIKPVIKQFEEEVDFFGDLNSGKVKITDKEMRYDKIENEIFRSKFVGAWIDNKSYFSVLRG